MVLITLASTFLRQGAHACAMIGSNHRARSVRIITRISGSPSRVAGGSIAKLRCGNSGCMGMRQLNARKLWNAISCSPFEMIKDHIDTLLSLLLL